MEDQAPYNRLINAMKQQAEEDKEFMEDVQEVFEDLNLHNSIYAELLLELARALTSFSIDGVDDPTSELEIDEYLGKGINLHSAIGSLHDYAKNDDDVNLDVALAYILREKERRILNEL